MDTNIIEKKKLGDKIKRIRLMRGLSQDELAKRCGYKARSTINKIETGINDVPRSKIRIIAQALEIDESVLLNDQEHIEFINAQQPIQVTKTTTITFKDSHNLNVQACIKIPILGTVIAGIPISAIEEIIGWEEISPKLASQGEYFALVIKGDSMSPTMDAGDVVIVRKQQDVNSGDIAIVCVNGDEATCKKIIKHKDGISLVSLNPKYEPMYYDKNDIVDKPIHIIGKVVELRRRF